MPTTPYTILHEYAPYVSPYNIDLIKEVALYKQQQVDASRQAINEQMDLLMGQDIVKAEDREYLQDRMQDTIARINRMYRGADLSSDGIVRHIQSEISSVLDDKVMNAISGTKEYRRMYSMLQKMQEKGEATYNDMNAYVAMKPAYAWLNDGQAGTALGQLTYTPYVDYNAEVAASMEEMRKLQKGTTITMPLYDNNGNLTGRMVTETKDFLTPEQAAERAMASLSAGARQQMMIEAQYMADSNPEAFSIDAARQYAMSQVSALDEYEASVRARLAGAGGNTSQAEQWENELRRVKGMKASIMEAAQGLDENTYSPYMGALSVVEGTFRSNSARKYAYDNSNYEYSSDTAYWEGLKARDREMDRAIKLRDLDIKEQRERRLAEGTSSPDGSGTQGHNTTTQVPYRIDPEVEDVRKMARDRYEKNREAVNMAGIRLGNALLPEDLEAIHAEARKDIQEKGDTSPYYGKDNNEILLTYFKLNGGLTNEMFSRAKEGSGNVNAYNAYTQLDDAYQTFGIDKKLAADEAAYRDRNMAALVDKYFGGNMEAAKNAAISFVADNMLGHGYLAGRPLPSDLRAIRNDEGSYDIRETLQPVWDMMVGDGTRLSDIISFVGNSEIVFNINDSSSEDAKELVNQLRNGINSSASRQFRNFFFDDPDVNAGLDEIRLASLTETVPLVTTVATKVDQKNYDYEQAQRAENIYFNRLSVQSDGKYTIPKAAEIRSFNIMPDGTAEDGQPQFRIWPNMMTGDNMTYKESDWAVIASLSDVREIGLSVDLTPHNLKVGRYDTGTTPVSFASAANKDYPAMLDANGVGAEYADKGSVMAGIMEEVNALFPVAAPDAMTGETPVTTRQNLAIMEAAKLIFDNYNYFGVRQKGYDKNTAFSNGVETTIYLIDPANKSKRPEKLGSAPADGIDYADNLAKQFALAPQKIFTEYIKSLIQKEASYMMRTGSAALDPDGELSMITRKLSDAAGLSNGNTNANS